MIDIGWAESLSEWIVHPLCCYLLTLTGLPLIFRCNWLFSISVRKHYGRAGGRHHGAAVHGEERPRVRALPEEVEAVPTSAQKIGAKRGRRIVIE